MNIEASGRLALILATGLWIGLAGPSLAAGDTTASSKPDAAASSTATDNSAKHASRHLKKYAHHKSGKEADKPDDKKAGDAATDNADNAPAVPSSQMPAAVANANAQLPAAEAPAPNTPAANAQAMSDRANTIVQTAPGNPADAQPRANGSIVASDQLNDVDRALQAAATPMAPVALASAEAPAVTASPPAAAAASGDSSTWDQTSLIGKIFIGFGALLTMASAARMFMA
jgi:hypothetical protein